jgi:hypothetical protein
MIIPITLWFTALTFGYTQSHPPCSVVVEELTQDSTLEFATPSLKQYENGFSIYFQGSFYTTDVYFTTIESSHEAALKHGYKDKGSCYHNKQELFISKKRITNQSI